MVGLTASIPAVPASIAVISFVIGWATTEPSDADRWPAEDVPVREVLLADDVYSIPVFSRPTYLLNDLKVKGVIKNPTQQGSTWNSETWSVTS